jgi:prevent-host-death family protein
MQVNMLEAKSQLSKLVKAALDGEDVIIANHGKPMVRLVKLVDQPKTRGYGAWKHFPPPADDWDSPETNAALAKLILDRSIEPAVPVRAPGHRAPAAKTGRAPKAPGAKAAR